MAEANRLERFNKFIEQLFLYWDGKITEEELNKTPYFGISKEVDEEMQRDSFY